MLGNRLGALIFLLVLTGCISTGLFYKKKDTHIRFGNTGGFTGETIAYLLNGEGGFIKCSSMTMDTIRYISVPMNEIKTIESMMNPDSLSKIVQDEYGNMTEFIEVYEDGKKTYAFNWPMGALKNNYLKVLNDKLRSLEMVEAK